MLRRRGLARLTPNTIELHRVPAALLHARSADHHSELDGWAGIVVRLMWAVVLPDDPTDNPPAWQNWRWLLPHVLAVTDPSRASDAVNELTLLLRHAGRYLLTLGESRAGRPLFERAYELNRNRLDGDDPRMLATATELAVMLAALGECERARALDEDTLARYRRLRGDDHPDTLTTAGNLAVRLAERQLCAGP
ncbi:MAG: tetratricopeptide repeat protein [Pseudonocardiales bacterium]|nr:tetratricopeptide repeat protein [Pseudonocardiales bacterium]